MSNARVATEQPGAVVATDTAALRLGYTLVLLPTVPAVSLVGTSYIDALTNIWWFDELRCFHLWFSALWVFGMVLIWRRYVVWTEARCWITVLVSAIPLALTIFGSPFSNFGPWNEEVLRLGQHEAAIGLSVWIVILVWWGSEKPSMSDDEEGTTADGMRVSLIDRRLIASVGSIPFVFGVFLILFVMLDEVARMSQPVAESFGLAAIVGVAVWISIWRRVVAWSWDVFWRTVVLTASCVGVPQVLLFAYWNPGHSAFAVLLVCFPIIGWGIWMVLTVTYWPISPLASTDGPTGPRCLSCGYLLIGLRSTRCPECGHEPTLDELWRISKV
ncbi:MAG: hypothetical protein PVI86_17130 [Phycisphaerae bacterium]|jgi:hypothetical protein